MILLVGLIRRNLKSNFSDYSMDILIHITDITKFDIL